ncbi:glycosyltransferase family 4 protein [Metallibacterium scheffleri]|uniref:Glycosyl transferase family 1 domain-containing protein n=1 Tax=Metallibacterium scheffleri TaxID=993689 RepID=A0A4S3KL33_9GAMM|nr:glycosyltransferase family 4 protein [Metallibacterium scheffleri]THD09547.1 hypothetical protein B1806_10790 [Metallibacterium scheffleri]
MTLPLSQVTMVGTFPPPMHGMATVNAAVRGRLLASAASVVVINTAPASLDRAMLARLGRLPRVMRGLARLAGTRHLRGTALYIGVSGGAGQTYDLAFLLLARLRKMRVFVHHHSFAYLHERRRLTAMLVRAAGRRATHITQSAGMAGQLRTLYGAANVAAVSNAVFLVSSSEQAQVRSRHELRVLGFLGNIAAEKGIFEFLDLMAALRQPGASLQGRIAGPFQDVATETRVRQRLQDLPNVEYVGAKYGAEKDAFFDGIDTLIFPTLYANEAEPLVVHEATQHGVPVIAYGRGCIPEVVTPECGCVIPPEAPFVPAALVQVEAWMRAPERLQAASVAAAASFASLQRTSAQRWRLLQAQIIGGAP